MSEQQRTKLSRREMVEIIERGESVIIPDPKSPLGKKLHVTRVEDLPDEADLVAGDSAAEDAAVARLDDDQRALDARRARLAAARASAKDKAEEEPTFHGKPLSAYDKYADSAALQKIDGIGEKTADDILAARAKRDKARK
jgi:hypothetical protein